MNNREVLLIFHRELPKEVPLLANKMKQCRHYMAVCLQHHALRDFRLPPRRR